jgi:hypothetical protein
MAEATSWFVSGDFLMTVMTPKNPLAISPSATARETRAIELTRSKNSIGINLEKEEEDESFTRSSQVVHNDSEFLSIIQERLQILSER